MNNKPYKVGLALSGGGAKGFVHIGALKALEEFGLKPEIISGVSAGSMIGALYCDGYTTDEIIEMIRPIKFGDLAELVMPKKSFFTMNGLLKFIEKNLRARTFEELKIPFEIIVTDMDHGKSVLFNSGGGLCSKIAASCSIPVLFPPVIIDGVHYVDGGVLKNFPVAPLKPVCDIVIGVNATPLIAREYKKSLISIAERSYHFMFKANSFQDKQLCDILIEPDSVNSYGLFDVEHIEEIVDKGYRATKHVLNQKRVQELLVEHSKRRERLQTVV